MNLLKKLWNFLFGKKEEEFHRDLAGTGSDLGLDEDTAEETVQHCGSHIRFKKSCLECLRVVGTI